MILAALLASVALAQPIDSLDRRHLVEQARVAQRYWGWHEGVEETTALVRTAATACHEIGGEAERDVFLLWGAVAGVESDFRRIAHDHGKGYGYIGCQPSEITLAASFLGVVVSSPQQREAIWRRFRADRTFGVWCECRHLFRLVGESEGDWLSALARHNGSKRYAGDVLLRWYRMWLEPAPLLIAAE